MTKSAHLSIVPGPAHQHIFGGKGRLLNRSEECRMSGIVPSSVRELPPHEVDIDVGSTFQVPLMWTHNVHCLAGLDGEPSAIMHE